METGEKRAKVGIAGHALTNWRNESFKQHAISILALALNKLTEALMLTGSFKKDRYHVPLTLVPQFHLATESSKFLREMCNTYCFNWRQIFL